MTLLLIMIGIAAIIVVATVAAVSSNFYAVVVIAAVDKKVFSLKCKCLNFSRLSTLTFKHFCGLN